jgi:hypothetical protein
MRIDDWFLAAGQRGNRHSAIDRRHDGVPWTEGNLAEILVDGSEYFTRLYSTLCATALGDSVYLTGLEGDADERLAGPDTEVAGVLADLVQRGVHVRGLVWRSHGASYSEEKNLMFSRAVNTAGGDVLLDNRIRRGGSHHQKLVVCSLGCPLTGWVPGDPGEVHVACVEFDEEQDVVATQPDGVDGEEVTRDDPGRLSTQERAP